jgi:hypothetical protein
VNRDTIDRISAASQDKAALIGIVRRYKIYEGYEDAVWIFERIKNFVATYSLRDRTARVTFLGTLKAIEGTNPE